MANIFGPIFRKYPAGIPITILSSPLPVDAVYGMGVWWTADGAMCATNAPPASWSNGLPFSEDGRLCRAGGTPVYFDQGIGFSATGQVCTTTSAFIDHSDQGANFNEQNRLTTDDS